jgi:hypothetical protein
MKAIVVVLVLELAGQVCRAQLASGSPPPPNCERGLSIAAPYAQCSLRLEGDRLLVAGREAPVSMEEPFRPVALSRFVVGDSARRYALQYEREVRTSMWLRFAGAAVMMAGSFRMMRQSPCGPHFPERQCMKFADSELFLLGAAVHLASYPLRTRGEWAGAKALGWHNGSLSGPR